MHRSHPFGRFLACTIVLGSGPAAAPQPTDAAAMQADVAQVLDASAQAWSRGDLDGFMQCYERSDATFYVGRTGIVRGYDAIRAMYASRFGAGRDPNGSPLRDMGRLSLPDLGRLSLQTISTQALGPDYALVAGRFTLVRSQGSSAGVFTLVLHHGAAGWRIVADHTS